MARVVVLGSSNTDMVVRVPRLPGRGETVLGGTFEKGPGGKGANQAVAAKRAGADVVFITAVGDDAFGKEALDLYRQEGIDVSYVKVTNQVSSGVALIFVEAGGENMIAVAPGANNRIDPEGVASVADSVFESTGVFLASLEVPFESVLRGLRRAKASSLTTILNPAPTTPELASKILDAIEFVDILTPNQSELRTLLGLSEADEIDPDLAAQKLRAKNPRLELVVTLGSKGCLVVSNEVTFVPARVVEAVDAVGAGDCFNGALAVALADGKALVHAAEWARDAAALSVTRVGAQSGLPFRSEIDRLEPVPKR